MGQDGRNGRRMLDEPYLRGLFCLLRGLFLDFILGLDLLRLVRHLPFRIGTR